MPDIKPFREQLAAVALAANAANAALKESSSSSSSSSGSSLSVPKERGEEGSGGSAAPSGWEMILHFYWSLFTYFYLSVEKTSDHKAHIGSTSSNGMILMIVKI